MTLNKKKIVVEYARMWPREIFDIIEENRLLAKGLNPLKNPGVYILYRDDHPYYIGKTKRSLFSRLHAHANMSTDRYFNFWNYFSVFVVPDKSHVDEVEGILIASMTTANSAVPKIKQIRLPTNVAKILRAARQNKYKDLKNGPK
jgi:hypothetical protein